MDIAERLRKGVESMTCDNGKGDMVNITISIGILGDSAHQFSLDAALQNADEALFQAKNKGRNQIAVYKSTVSE
jgi:diguanylate cyclase (GGDEF)-like protein